MCTVLNFKNLHYQYSNQQEYNVFPGNGLQTHPAGLHAIIIGFRCVRAASVVHPVYYFGVGSYMYKYTVISKTSHAAVLTFELLEGRVPFT